MSLPDYMVAARPLGISILAILHGVGGVVLVGLGAALPFIATQQPDIAKGLAIIGIPLPLMVAGILFLGVLGIASCVGMWIGAKWGWSLGTFYYVYSIVRNVSALATAFLVFGEMPVAEASTMARGPEYYYLKFGLRAVIHTLIFLYFFKQNVLEYFNLRDVKRWKVAAIEFGVCIALAVAFTVWSSLSS